MKFLRQFLIVLCLSLVGELLKAVLPLPIPASVYGLVLMLLCLHFGCVKVTQVKDAAVFLIEIMPVMFIPAAVGVGQSWGSLKPMLLPLVVIMVLTTLLVMGVTGIFAEKMIQREKQKNG